MPIPSTTSSPTRGADEPVDLTRPHAEAGTAPVPAARRRSSPTRVDLAVAAVFMAGALWVTHRLWLGPGTLRTAANPADEDVFEWFLAHGARWVTHGGNPFFSHQVLAPEGANLMVNTSSLGLSVPLAPLTLALGPHVTFVLAVTLCLGGTAYGWYHVLSRHVVGSRFAAFLGAALCGFGPGMISHAGGQLDLVANFLVPFLVWGTLRLAQPGRTVRRGIGLGLLGAYQMMIAEEVLFLTGITLGVFIALAAVQRRAAAREALPRFLRGSAVAALTAALLVGYPLWFQFFGPRRASGVMAGVRNAVTPLQWYVSTPPGSLGGNPTANNVLYSVNEANSFFGWPLVVLVTGVVVWQWRDPVVRALAGAGLVAGMISLGTTVRYGPFDLGPGPFRALASLPLFDKLTPSRFGLAVMVVFGVLVALGADRWGGVPTAGVPVAGVPTVRRAGLVALCAALLPLVPAPLATSAVPPTPQFITSGAWRGYVGPGQSVVGVPVPMFGHTEAMRWSTATGLEMVVASGYMLGPVGANGSPVDFNPPARPLRALLNAAADHARVPAMITGEQRREVVEDLRYWRAAIVVARVDEPKANQIRALCDALFGWPVETGGVWVWDVRGLT